jgi:hypothetical protein
MNQNTLENLITDEQRREAEYEEFYWQVRRRMTHGFITAQFLRDQLNKIEPGWDTVHGEALVQKIWGERCPVHDKECPTCIAWDIFDRNKVSGVEEAEPTIMEVINEDRSTS